MGAEQTTPWGVIERRLEQHEFGYDLIQEHGGIPTDSYVVYMTSDYTLALMGIMGINNLATRKVYLLQNQGLMSEAGEPLVLNNRTDQNLYEVCARYLGGTDKIPLGHRNTDDGLVFLETEKDFWIFWFSTSGRDSIYRLSKARFSDETLQSITQSYLASHAPKIIVEIVPIGRMQLGQIIS